MVASAVSALAHNSEDEGENGAGGAPGLGRRRLIGGGGSRRTRCPPSAISMLGDRAHDGLALLRAATLRAPALDDDDPHSSTDDPNPNPNPNLNPEP